uniref:Uncharacterized protein n=1 Tax=Lepeophtheirus salmonis TaxID=72036 RepID=A0A0K2TWN6_LEPSM
MISSDDDESVALRTPPQTLPLEKNTLPLQYPQSSPPYHPLFSAFGPPSLCNCSFSSRNNYNRPIFLTPQSTTNNIEKKNSLNIHSKQPKVTTPSQTFKK